MATSTKKKPVTSGSSARQAFLEAYEREHATTMRLLRAYPKDKLDLQPHPKCKTARDLAWVFAIEAYLGTKGWHDEFAKGVPSGAPPSPPESWDQHLQALEKAHKDFGALVRATPDQQLHESIKFMTGPKQLGDVPRMQFLWFLLHDQIHHRGQFSIYSRMADGKVPSIYGPTADEPWR